MFNSLLNTSVCIVEYLKGRFEDPITKYSICCTLFQFMLANLNAHWLIVVLPLSLLCPPSITSSQFEQRFLADADSTTVLLFNIDCRFQMLFMRRSPSMINRITLPLRFDRMSIQHGLGQSFSSLSLAAR